MTNETTTAKPSLGDLEAAASVLLWLWGQAHDSASDQSDISYVRFLLTEQADQLMVDAVFGPCAYCGAGKASGWAFINDIRYCHGDDESPTCYERAVAKGTP